MITRSWFLKKFDELSKTELYNILRLRSSIFVIEQKCIFEDIDGKDIGNCYHLLCSVDNKVIAYARIFPPKIIYEEPCISRVCTSLDQRGRGLGKELMEKALGKMEILFPRQPIRIGAQTYLKNFYEDFGFETIGNCYKEDGIEHIQMIKNVK